MSTHPGGAGSLFVHDDVSWWATPPGEREPRPVAVEDLPLAEPMSLADDAPEVAASDIVSVGGPTVVAFDPTLGTLVTGHPRTGATVALDRDDAALLAIDRPTRAGDLFDRCPDAPARLARLVDLAMLDAIAGFGADTLADVSMPDASMPDAGATDPPRSPSGGARSRRWPSLRRVRPSAATEPDPTPEPTHEPAQAHTGESEDERLRRAHRGPTTTDLAPASRPTGGASPSPGAPIGRTRVLAAWDVDQWGQSLALGGLLAYLRVAPHDLASRYDIRRVASHEEVLEELDRDSAPAVVLLSSYMWSAERNLETTREVAARGSHLVIHGGPHVPKYADEARRFFAANPGVGMVVHGEGEITLAELLHVLDGDPDRRNGLGEVAGISFRTHDGPVTTPERARHDTLEDFPSPYLTGEFDHLDTSGWLFPSVETDRGCPYSCTYCDWGSATRSRIRLFPIERVLGELDWLAARGLSDWMINDANFGIHARDVDIARYVVELRRRTGAPNILYVNYAKNTVRHLVEIIRMLVGAGVMVEGALALQTWDAETLRAVKRSNIKLEAYDSLREEFIGHGLPLMTDLIIGLPGQTVASFVADLQQCVDLDITPRFFVALSLPNAEMNAPEYREKFRLVIGDGDVVVASTTFTRDDRERMMRLRMAYRCFEHFAVLRPVMRLLQWDHGIPVSESIDRIERRLHDEPDRWPLLAWIVNNLDVFLAPPVGWRAVGEEVARLLADEFGVERDEGVDTALAVQELLLPARGRTFPAAADLAHDYVAWYHDNAAGRGGPALRDRPPGRIEVDDPTNRCRHSITRLCDVRPHELVAAPFWMGENWELRSPVARLLTATATEPKDHPTDASVGGT